MHDRSWRLEPYFIPGSAGRIHATLFVPNRHAVSNYAVLIVPPFAEEMNKCRPMLAGAARALAEAGLTACIIDLFGTGDSEGDFADATWTGWRQDIVAARNWLRSRGSEHIHVLAVRSGALFLNELKPTSVAECKVALWQPIVRGADYWRQFLRLRIAAAAVRAGSKELSPQEQLARDGSIEIAGYTVMLELANGLAAATLDLSAFDSFTELLWAEVTMNEPPTLSLGTQKLLNGLTKLQDKIEKLAIRGEPFWATPEIAKAQTLIDRTVEFFSQPRRERERGSRL